MYSMNMLIFAMYAAGMYSCFRDAWTCPSTMWHFNEQACAHPERPSTTIVGWPLVIGRTGLKGNHLERNMYHRSEALRMTTTCIHMFFNVYVLYAQKII